MCANATLHSVCTGCAAACTWRQAGSVCNRVGVRISVRLFCVCLGVARVCKGSILSVCISVCVTKLANKAGALQEPMCGVLAAWPAVNV